MQALAIPCIYFQTLLSSLNNNNNNNLIQLNSMGIY
jgi:hypothetical protein